ncbi:hypothetical protein ACHAXN_010202 [Cyclotella atomus]
MNKSASKTALKILQHRLAEVLLRRGMDCMIR